LKKVKIFLLCFLLLICLIPAAYAAEPPDDGVWHDLSPGAVSPNFVGKYGAIEIIVNELHYSQTQNIPYPLYMGSLVCYASVTTYPNYLQQVCYVPPSGTSTVIEEWTGPLSHRFGEITVESVATNGIITVTVNGSQLYTATDSHDFSGTFTNASDRNIRYCWSSTGNIPNQASSTVMFTLPSNDGCKDGAPTWKFYTYYKVPVDVLTAEGDINLAVTGGVAGSGDTISNDVNFVIEGDQRYAEGYFVFTRDLNLGENEMKLAVTAEGETYYGFRTVERVQGIVDENADGIDDRTNKPNVETAEPLPSESEMPVRGSYEDTIFGTLAFTLDTILYFIKAPFVFIGDCLNSILEWLAESTTFIAQVTLFLGAIFGFLPPQFLAGLTAIFSVIVVFTILKVMRG